MDEWRRVRGESEVVATRLVRAVEGLLLLESDRWVMTGRRGEIMLNKGRGWR